MDNLPTRETNNIMASNETEQLKLRFRLPNGEEFEAQGTPEFIEQERAKFLALLSRSAKSSLAATAQAPALPMQNTPFQPTTPQLAESSALTQWERLLKEDGNTLVLRHKTKLSTPEIALILLAGARVLLKKPAYPALELARSLKACGAEEGRLDRLLAGEIQAGRLVGEGTKRGRTYALTEQGLARAFALAQKLSPLH